jgi:phosphohistidine phosphatase SixA
MILYLIRHAFAGEPGDPRWPDDSQRPLAKDGRKRFAKVVRRLADSGEFAPRRIATSPYVRCRQTADVTSEACDDPPEVTPLDALAPGGDIEQIIAWTREQDVDAVAWVGHAPDIEDQTAALLGLPTGHIRFAKGAIAALTFSGGVELGQGELRWLVTAKLLGK